MPDTLSAARPDLRFTVCPHDCPSTCGMEVERLDDHTVGRLRGSREQTYTDGVICAKVARYAERIHHPDRLMRPLLRTGPKGSGQFREIGWNEALDRTADALLSAEHTHGTESVWPYYYAGTMGLVMRDSINRLRHAKRYSGQYSTICTTLAFNGFVAGTGALRGVDPREMADADVIVIWGTNPVNTQVNVWSHAAKARKTRGARIVVVDTYRNGTAEQADQFLCVRPGTDGALACGVMNVLFRENLADRAWLARYTDAPDELEAHLAGRTPEWAEAISGVPVAEIEAFARLLGRNPRAYFRLGYGFSRSRNGTVNMHAASCIPAVIGAWQYEGGGALMNNGAIYGWDKTLIEGLDVRDPGVRMLDQSRIGAILTGEQDALGGGPPVTALFTQNTNPMSVAPDLGAVHRGFAREDLFVCVHEQFMTETARMADVILPATMFMEHDDLYQGGGHQHIQLGFKVVEPPGECRSNHEVIGDLARRVGAEHPGFGMDVRDLIEATLAASGRPGIAEIQTRGGFVDIQPDFATAHYLDGFAWSDGKFRFRPDWAAIAPAGYGGRAPEDMPRLPDHWEVIDAATNARPFRMVTAPSRGFLNSTFNETPGSRAREGRPTLMIHPDDAATLGIADGAEIEVGNDRGAVHLYARIFDGVRSGVVIHEGIWPNADFPGGVGINLLTGAEPGSPVGGAVFHDTAVWLRPA